MIININFIFNIINMRWDESYHSESEFYYLDEMANDDNEKENIAAITNEENRENDNVFTPGNVQNYILAQRAENTVKKNRVWLERLEEAFM